jgi:hypothetical protein
MTMTEGMEPSAVGSAVPDPGRIRPSRRTFNHNVIDPVQAEGLSIQSLRTGTEVLARTQHSTYRMVVLDPENRRVRLSGGALFRRETEAVIEGATAGACVLKLGWIGVGLQLEISHGDQRARTSTVDAVTIVND